MLYYNQMFNKNQMIDNEKQISYFDLYKLWSFETYFHNESDRKRSNNYMIKSIEKIWYEARSSII